MSPRPLNKPAVERAIRIVAALAVVSVMSLALMLVLSSSPAAHAGVADANPGSIKISRAFGAGGNPGAPYQFGVQTGQ